LGLADIDEDAEVPWLEAFIQAELNSNTEDLDAMESLDFVLHDLNSSYPVTKQQFIPLQTQFNKETKGIDTMKHILKHRFKPGPIALGLGLMLTTLCYGQASYAGPPHNVIYWDGYTGDGSLQTLVYSAYTDVIVNFVVPDQNCNLSSSGPNGDLPD